MHTTLPNSIAALREAYANGTLNPATVVQQIIEGSRAYEANNIWIQPPNAELIEPFVSVLSKDNFDALPLWGIPFAVKDNIDVAGFATTAGCSAYTYTPEQSAYCVQLLVDAGAIPVGKTNLDQFATGLVGTRSPWGATTHPDRPDHVSGGSSSGSAIAVACGLACFALGTDTAGSGRIPAAFNSLIGLKPTRGLVSTQGVVPACQTLDCVSIFGHTVEDVQSVSAAMYKYNAADPWARQNTLANATTRTTPLSKPLTLAVIAPEDLQFFGDAHYADSWQATLSRLQAAGVELEAISFAPFATAARELYEGPWVTERYLATREVLAESPNTVMDVTAKIIAPGVKHRATELFESMYNLAELRTQCLAALADKDGLLTPTAGRHYRLHDLQDDPITPNSNLGYYTNYMNLLDLCGIALPGLPTQTGMPFGISLIGDRFTDAHLLSVASHLHSIIQGTPTLAHEFTPAAQTIDLLVCGAHMQGLPLNWQLTDRNAELLYSTQTATCYRLYALPGGPPARPGMVRDIAGGQAIGVEVWRLPIETLGSFQAGIPWPLGIGKVELANGEWVSGFICEQAGLEGATDISHHGNWRNYLADAK